MARAVVLATTHLHRHPVRTIPMRTDGKRTCVIVPGRVLIAWDHGVGINHEDIQQPWGPGWNCITAILQMPPCIIHPASVLHACTSDTAWHTTAKFSTSAPWQDVQAYTGL